MQVDEVKAILESNIKVDMLDVAFEGNHVKIVIVSNDFEGLSTLKRQQKVYACLQDSISSGAIHAVHMKTYTSDQWSKLSA